MITLRRKRTVTIVAFGLLAGSSGFFFQSAPNFPTDTTPSPPPTNPSAIRPNPDEATAPAATDASALPPAIPATYQLPSLVQPSSVVAPAPVEIELPPPPSGDYELNLTAEQISAIVEKRYAGLFQALGLPPERLARLRSLLVERQQATVDAANAALLVGINPVRELLTIRHAIAQYQAEIDTSLRNELGESVFAAYRDFDRTLGERNSVGDFARLLAATSEPLRPEQEAQVMQILKNFPGWDSPVDFARAIYGGIDARARISEQAVAAATTVLSPRQLELFRQIQQRQVAVDAYDGPIESLSR